MSGSPETIHERGRAALLEGRYVADTPPSTGTRRWGLSLVARPDPAAADRLDELSAQAAELAGPGHWRTGRRGTSHLTVCYLEHEHRDVPDGDARVAELAELVSDVSRTVPALSWELTGVSLADRGVLALATPVDDSAAAFRADVVKALGAQGDREATYRRSVWWATLLHFAAPVVDVEGLASWADEHHDRGLGPLSAASVDLVRYVHDGRQMVPKTVAAVRLGDGEVVRSGAPS